MATIAWIDNRAVEDADERIGFAAIVWFIGRLGHEIVKCDDLENPRLEEIIRTCDLILLDLIMEPTKKSQDPKGAYGGLDVLKYIADSGEARKVVVLSVVSEKKFIAGVQARGIDLKKAGVRLYLRKGSLKPSEVASRVQEILEDDAVGAK